MGKKKVALILAQALQRLSATMVKQSCPSFLRMKAFSSGVGVSGTFGHSSSFSAFQRILDLGL